ncbi:MAG: hypothetical protein DSZ09_00855, partial [Sulfurovum sp.]
MYKVIFVTVLTWLVSGCGGGGGANNSFDKIKCDTNITDTISTGEEYSKEICPNIEGVKFKIISNQVEGMIINPKTSKIYWTPTPNQA